MGPPFRPATGGYGIVGGVSQPATNFLANIHACLEVSDTNIPSFSLPSVHQAQEEGNSDPEYYAGAGLHQERTADVPRSHFIRSACSQDCHGGG